MQQALDNNILDRLTALGRQQGQLTTLDLEANLPIESMSAEEIARIVVHLEESGIPVELEDTLVSPASNPPATPVRSAEIIPFPDRTAAVRMKQRTTPMPKAMPVQPNPAFVQQEKRAAHWGVAAAGLLVLGSMLAALILFGV